MCVTVVSFWGGIPFKSVVAVAREREEKLENLIPS